MAAALPAAQHQDQARETRLADARRPRRDRSADSRRNRHQASDSLPSTRCRSPVTSYASVHRSSARRSPRNAPARQRSPRPRLAATPDARVANAVYRPFVNASSARWPGACSSKAPALACGAWADATPACVWPRIRTRIPVPVCPRPQGGLHVSGMWPFERRQL
jgi:hypothetical protein